ncbi:PREDICTED: PP2C-like domain-containing protein CG9801 isoform X2 [Nicrophorus vespilloides]|uniref:PP2C-like domain-containing protein CG9801 isoform X2 n=1 Tax=Nicrophorus vespilloides TaxID=110193 RepID=A0ABM1N3K5_NICVS|nr:PREDICTED: PP2C-like domain-containing protein CG9801 isoform X2 [Nicrophorus vespilloides]
MPSLRKRVSSYFRQLSFHNEPREKRHNFIENTFINKYLQGQIRLRDGPPIIYGKNPTDLPNYDLGTYQTGSSSIVGCYTGPHGGLTTVQRSEKHLSVLDQDIDFIDTQDEASEQKPSPVEPPLKSPNRNSDLPLDNTTMVIKVAGQEYYVTNRRKTGHGKSQSLGSLKDFGVEIDTTKVIQTVENNNVGSGDEIERVVIFCDSSTSSKEPEQICGEGIVEGGGSSAVEADVAQKKFALAKSKSEGNPFNHKKRGKITRLAQRPVADAVSDKENTSSTASDDVNLPQEWNHKTEHVYGLSDSLYDKNLITKTKNGEPIADCFGVIARNDSAILAVADGVNWGEKASIAAKSAIHGCLHYLNKTIFQDTKPFDNLVKSEEGSVKSETPVHESRIGNTREVFVCLLRAFNCAHDLILENKGMLTTLTVAVVLPLKQSNVRRTEGSTIENYICCVCNVGDTLAYVYSQKYGVRELTKGSHDINCNRDMRDALGALGPVDGINPELSNLTLSITTIQKGDIILVASDGLTDNFDPNVCKFTVNTDPPKVRKPSQGQIRPPPKKVPIKPPRKIAPPPSAETTNKPTTTSKPLKPATASSSTGDPLVEQFMKDNALQPSQENKPSQKPIVAVRKPEITKPIQRTNSDRSPQGQSKPTPQNDNRYNFLRSKTSLDLRSRAIPRNPDGMPYVTPLQRYELTLLMIEDILKRGISGKENQCVTAKRLCENLISFTVSITNAKRRTLEDNDLYFDNRNGLLVEVSHQEKKMRRKRGLERVQNLPGKLDHVTVVACNVGNVTIVNV